jgi:hypothetical protein
VQIGFFVESKGLDFAKLLIESAKKVMPDVPIFQLTNGECEAVAEPIRIPGSMPMGVRRLTHYSRLEGDWVFVDTDVLFLKDVRHVFDKPFDIALASRKGTLWEGSEYAKKMPHNFGVVFSRSPKFWRIALEYLKRLPPKLQEWEGEQFVTGQMAEHPGFSVEILPSSYNFTPAEKTDDMTHVHVAHYKGPRKSWILES